MVSGLGCLARLVSKRKADEAQARNESDSNLLSTPLNASTLCFHIFIAKSELHCIDVLS